VSGSAFDFDEVVARGLSRQFGRRRALWKVDFTCRAGQIVGLLGPNGAGKSTLIGILSSLLQPTSGEVRYGGRLAAEIGDPLRARVGVLGHDLFLYSDLTARENLAFFGRLYGVGDLDAKVARALAQARLAERAGERVGGFSRGLRQRLALERALLHDPTLVLLDEPFTGLDDESASLLIDRLASLRQAGAIVVMASHDFESADRVIDRAICLDAGRAQELAPGPGALRDRYRRRTPEAAS
jgi:ABC-type multidrug transport system ATPase subunit